MVGAAGPRVWLGLVSAALSACAGSVDVDPPSSASGVAVGSGGASGTAGLAGSDDVASSASSGGAGGACPAPPCTPVSFAFETECNDCMDNDGDGLVDLEDPPCFAPWAYSETAFVGAVGDDVDPCELDCAFDANFGSGDDGCDFDLACDPLEPLRGCLDPTVTCPAATRKCAGFCVPLAPNGCDCFGCCELPARSGQFVYVVGAGCTVNPSGEPELCSACTPRSECLNGCEPCEMCLGDTAPPDGCAVQVCPADRAPCGQPCQPGCASDEYCLNGCCARPPDNF